MDAWALDIPQLRADNRPPGSLERRGSEAGGSLSSLDSSSSEPEAVGDSGTGQGSGRVAEGAEPGEDYTSSDLATSSTIPVGDEDLTDSLPAEKKAVRITSSSHSSTSSTSSSDKSSFGVTSLYQPEFLTPVINYDRDNEQQKLIAIIGREFDRPSDIVSSLQKWIPKQPKSEIPVVKFVPFTPRRKMLLKGSFDSQELKKHDLICMCYNASEARILLTGPDGFYTSLLKHVETLLGPNKVSFLISNYNPPLYRPEPVSPDSDLLPPSLKTRLYHQQPLRVYLDSGQVLSWSDGPSELQANRLIELANSELNPQSMFSGQCQLL